MDQDDRAARQAKVSKALSSAYLTHQIQELENKVNIVGTSVQATVAGVRPDAKGKTYDEYEFPPLGAVGPPRERIVSGTGSRDLRNGFPTLEEGRHGRGNHDGEHGWSGRDHREHGRHERYEETRDDEHGRGLGHGRGRGGGGGGRGGRGRGGPSGHGHGHKGHRRIDDSTEKSSTDTGSGRHGHGRHGRGGRKGGRGRASHGSHWAKSFVHHDEDEEKDVRRWRVVVLDSSALMWAPNQVRRLVNQGWEVVVPLEALKTLDLLKGGNSPSARAARAATRYIEHASRHYRPNHRPASGDKGSVLGLTNSALLYRGGRGLRLQADNETKPPEEISSLPIPPSSGDADEVLPKWMINVLSCAAYFTAIAAELSNSIASEQGPPLSPEDDNQAVLFVANPSFESESITEHSFVERGEGFLVSQEAQRFEIPLEILRDEEEVEERGGGRERGRGRGRGRGGKRGGRRGEEGHEEVKEKEEPTQVRILVRPAALDVPPPSSKSPNVEPNDGAHGQSDTKASPSVPAPVISSPSVSSPRVGELEDLPRKSMEHSPASPFIPPPEFSPRPDHLVPGSVPSPSILPRSPRPPRPPPTGPASFGRHGRPPGPPPFPNFPHHATPPRPGFFPPGPPFPPPPPYSPHASQVRPPPPPLPGFNPFGPPRPPLPLHSSLNPEAPVWRGRDRSDTSSTSSDSDSYSHTFSHGSQEAPDTQAGNFDGRGTFPFRGMARGWGRGRGDRGGFRGRGGGFGPGAFASAPPGTLGQDWGDRGRGRGGPGRGSRGRGEANLTLLRRGGAPLAGFSSMDGSYRTPDPAFDRPAPASKHLWDENRHPVASGRRDESGPRDAERQTRRAAHTVEDREKSTREREKLGRFLEKARERNERDREREVQRAEKRKEREQRNREREMDRAEREMDRQRMDLQRESERLQREGERIQRESERLERQLQQDAERRERQLEQDAERRERQLERDAEQLERDLETAARHRSRDLEQSGRDVDRTTAAIYADDGPKMILLQRPK